MKLVSLADGKHGPPLDHFANEIANVMLSSWDPRDRDIRFCKVD